MGDVLGLLLLLACGGAGWWWWQRRRARQLAAAQSLDRAAVLLGGQVQHSARDPARGHVLFEEAGQRYRLYREHRAQPGLDQAQCVVEVDGAHYAGPELVLASTQQPRTTLPAPQHAWPLPWPDLAERAVALAAEDPTPALQGLLDDPELRTRLRHALDHRGARLRLSPRGCWFECEGFADNGELVAATARTAAHALAGLLGRAAGDAA